MKGIFLNSYFLILNSLITGGILLASCSADTEGTDNFEEKHVAELENMAFSAGTSTIFLDSSKSFDTDAEWLRIEDRKSVV